MAEDTYFRVHKEVMQEAQEVNYTFGKRKKSHPVRIRTRMDNGEEEEGLRNGLEETRQTPTSGLLELKNEVGEGHGRPATSLCCARK